MQTFLYDDIEIIPAIDLRGGSCVRLHQGRFDRETVFDDDPVRAAWHVARGARMLHVVDLDGARSGRGANLDVIARLLADLPLAIQCGGGLRTREDVRRLLDLGASRVVLGSIAVEQPKTVIEWLQFIGRDRLVVALDARADERGTYKLASRGWQERSDTRLEDALSYFSEKGVRHVLCTDIERDGAMGGPSIDLYRQLSARFPDVQLQASGGVRHTADLAALAGAGIRQVIVGRALLESGAAKEEQACQPSA
ncbi:MAG: 1-(5-phosphoribosyl)-5-[(5-phosphoribosylamino)methylideneamino]imidazole-4-carboxamide isomerase [Gammaproteobacteria bacterium]|nr:1-(5-phosphoribosyl)-5-[(5-phosphoribosylamino)methylideneamino]imidazole-4-carboxamide isomerase [Gammaproteobacteria bacterium]